jgi:hypothetical protein
VTTVSTGLRIDVYRFRTKRALPCFRICPCICLCFCMYFCHALPSLIARTDSGFPMQISSRLSRPAPRAKPNRQNASSCCLVNHKNTLRHFIQSPVDIHQQKGRCSHKGNYVRGHTDTACWHTWTCRIYCIGVTSNIPGDVLTGFPMLLNHWKLRESVQTAQKIRVSEQPG